MKTITFWFTSSNKIGSILIKKGLMFQYNHVGIEFDDTIYDATLFKGVAKQNKKAFLSKYVTSESISFDIDANKARNVKCFLENQVGKPYDWIAIVSFPLQRDWEKADSWHCSELGAKVAMISNIITAARMPKNKISPRDLYLMLPGGK